MNARYAGADATRDATRAAAVHADLRQAFDADPFGRTFGLRAEAAQVRAFRSLLDVGPQHQIDDFFVHGGCQAAICEQTNRFAARTVLPPETVAATTELQMQYLAGASGRRLSCAASVVAVARHGLVVDCTLHSGTGADARLVAHCRSTVGVVQGAVGDLALADALAAAPIAPAPAAADTGAGADWRQFVMEDFSGGWRRFCGAQPVHAAHGSIDMVQQVAAHHRDANGYVLAGFIAPFADLAGGACAYSTVDPQQRLATLDFTVSYLNAAVRAQAIHARARAIKVGKTVVVSRVDVFGAQPRGEALMATALVTVMRASGHQRVLRDQAQQQPAPAPGEASIS